MSIHLLLLKHHILMLIDLGLTGVRHGLVLCHTVVVVVSAHLGVLRMRPMHVPLVQILGHVSSQLRVLRDWNVGSEGRRVDTEAGGGQLREWIGL